MRVLYTYKRICEIFDSKVLSKNIAYIPNKFKHLHFVNKADTRGIANNEKN